MKKMAHLQIRLLPLGITAVLLGMSCSSINAWMPTATPTQTPYPFPVEWSKLLSDDFSANTNGWRLDLIDDEWGTTQPGIIDGRLHLNMKSKGQGIRNSVGQTALRSLKNFYIAIDVEQLDKSVDSYWGLEFRATEAGAYVFIIEPKAKSYSLAYVDADWNTIIDWTTTTSILSDQPVRIGLIVEGSRMDILINGKKVDSITDSHSQAPGSFSVTVGLLNPHDEVTVAFDNLLVFSP